MMATNKQRIAILETQIGLLVRALKELVDGHSQQAMRPWLEAISPGLFDQPSAPPWPEYAPLVSFVQGTPAGRFSPSSPQGVILHGSRSGRPYTLLQEFRATLNYVRQGADGYGWNATIGEDMIATHLSFDEWGWNARSPASETYLAVEFAQPTVESEITDAQVHAFCWWFSKLARFAWPELPLVFPSHAETISGQNDGKTDPWPMGDVRADDLRDQITARLAEEYGIQ